MAEKTVRIEGTVPVSTPSAITVSGYVTTTETPSPAEIGRYIYNTVDTPGVVAATNHVSLTNPAGSGRSVILVRFALGRYTVGVVGSSAVSMVLYRATAVSGGTTQAASSILKLRTSSPDPVGVVRTANPSATLGAVIAVQNPLITDKAGGESGSLEVAGAPPGSGILLAEGESVVIRTSAGDIDQRWSIGISWIEI